MKIAFKITQGNRPTVSDQLKEGGVAVNLTGCTVKFLFQGPGVDFSPDAVIVSAETGQVRYQFAAVETDIPGDYYGQWEVRDAGGLVRSFPTPPFQFVIEPALPVMVPASMAKLSDFFDDIRAVAGDFRKRKIYQDSDIASVMRTQLRLGRVKTDCQRWKVSADGFGVTPAITSEDTLAYGLLVYHSAHTLILPDVAAYSYRTRALSERFGDKKDFLFELQNAIYDLESGNQVYSNVSGLRNWLFAVNGIWVWSYLQTEQTVDLSFK